MAIDSLPQSIRDSYLIKEVHHAAAVLETDFPEQYAEILAVLGDFRLFRSEVEAAIKVDCDKHRLGMSELLRPELTICTLGATQVSMRR